MAYARDRKFSQNRTLYLHRPNPQSSSKPMRRVGHLYEKVITFDNIYLAAQKAISRKKSKRSVTTFYFNLENEIVELKKDLESRTYRPGAYTQFDITEPKQPVSLQ